MPRREEIVEVTLSLLAHTPMERITTRQIAGALGVSQPALFRHFFSRDAILLATLATSATQLEQAVGAAIAAPNPPLARAHLVADALAAYAVRHPGLPRLLFADTVEESPVRPALDAIVTRQRAVVSTLVREAQGRGEVPAVVDVDRAAALFVSGLQGVLLGWLRDGAAGRPDIAAFCLVWEAGLRAGVPTGRVVASGTTPSAEVDAASMLARGVDPLPEILRVADDLAPGGRLRVVAPFLPVPLITLLEGRGWVVTRVEGAAFTIDARKPS